MPRERPRWAFSKNLRGPELWQRFRSGHARIKNPSVRATAFALADAMIAWRDGKGPRPDIDLVKRSLAHNSQSLSPDAAVVLGLLLENDPAAASVLMATFQDAPAMARAQLIQFIQWPHCVPRTVLAQLADRALEDRSHFVRTAAISLAEKLRLRRALPRLHALLKEARPGPLSDHITYAIANIERGYYAKKELSGKWRIVLATRTGRSYFSVADSAVRKHGLKGAIDRDRDASRPPRVRRRER